MLDLIDTSVWQGNIDWGAVSRSGIAGAISKASEGLGYRDPQWSNNQAGMLSVSPGFVGGSYHFLRPDLGSSPAAEADFYLGCHDQRVFNPGTPWIFALDAESAGGSAGGCYAFLDRVSSQVGYDCWFYSYTSWIGARGVQAFNRPLWIAAPSAPRGNPPAMGWPAVTAHQWGTRSVPGISGGVDANDFLGDHATLLKLAGIGGAGVEDMTPEEHEWARSLNDGWRQIYNQTKETHDWVTNQVVPEVAAIKTEVEALKLGGGQVDVAALTKAVADQVVAELGVLLNRKP